MKCLIIVSFNDPFKDANVSRQQAFIKIVIQKAIFQMSNPNLGCKIGENPTKFSTKHEAVTGNRPLVPALLIPKTYEVSILEYRSGFICTTRNRMQQQ